MEEHNRPKANFFRYRGRSMWPGFQESDLLEIAPCDPKQLRVGDCIVYQHPKATTTTVHRICSNVGDSYLTRGDARPKPDDDAVKPEWIQGRVVARFRFSRQCAVTGGWQGVMVGFFYRYAGRVDPDRDARGGRVARALRKSLQGISSKLYKKGLTRRFTASERLETVYWMIGDRVIATFDNGNSRWVITWPYSLLLDPDCIPAIES